MSKKYYWLKLNENFYEEDTIVWLEEQENGVSYVNFYLKLLLKSLSEEGKLVRYVGETLVPYDTKALSKLTNTPVDTVVVAMRLFIEIGLIKQLEAGELYMTQINEMIGSETESAVKMRRLRARETALQLEEKEEGHIVTESDQHIEIDIELDLEKETYKELDKENNTSFDNFYSNYPKKVSKGQAKKTFEKLVKDKVIDDEVMELILKDLENRKNYDGWKDKKFIPHPSTYLNNYGWEDEYETTKKKEPVKLNIQRY